MQVSGEAAHQLGLVPLVWLLAQRSAGVRFAPQWWAMAAAFLISWLADWVSHWTSTFPVGPFYLLGQGTCIVWALCPTTVAEQFTGLLAVTINVAVATLDMAKPDVLVHTVAWLGLLVCVWGEPMSLELRVTLLLAFVMGWLAWLGYVVRPGWTSWLAYQGVRASSVVAFCWASWRPPVREAWA